MRLVLQMGSAALGVACLAATARSQSATSRSQASSATSSGKSGGSMGGGMSLSSRVSADYQQSYIDSAGARIDWMEYVILWRGQPGWRSVVQTNEADRAASLRAWNEARLAAEMANHGFSGSGGANPYWVETDWENQRLYILGQAFAIPPRGSTLVVLVDRIDRVGGEPIVAASAVIDGQLPSDIRGKSWTSGDTTFSIRPSKNGIELFLETLKQDPAIATFLAEAPRSPK